MKFNTQYVRIAPMTAETNYAASETIPDDSLSIPEILSKYIRGQRVDGSFPSGFETPEEGVEGTFDELFDGPQEPATPPATPSATPSATPPATPSATPPATPPAEGQKVDE